MAKKADGTVYINSLMDTSGFKAGSREIETTSRRMASKVSQIGKSIKNAFSFSGKSGGGNAGEQFETIGEKVERLKESLKYLSDVKGLSFGNTDYDSVYQALVVANDELRKYRKELQEAAMQERNYAGNVGALKSALLGLRDAVHAPISMIKALGEAIKSIPTKAFNRLSGGFKKVGSVAKSVAKIIGGALLSGIKKSATSMLGLGKSTDKTRMSLGRMLAMSLLFSAVFRAISTVTGGIKEGFQNLSQYSKETNTSISSLMSSLTQLKNSFATAFAPVLNVVAPILTAFINMVSKAVTYVGMLIAALTGQNSFVKATAVQEDYAASLENTSDKMAESADATKEAEKAAEGYLSPLDEINKFTKEQDSQSGKDNSLLLPGYTAPTPQDMFETVPIENSLKSLADKIREFFKSEDWQGLGELIADGLNRGMEKVKNAISWNNVGPSVTHFVDAFTTTLNSLVDNLDWSLLGQTIGEGINTIVNTINLLADKINWVNIGASLANGLNGLFDAVNPQNLGKLLSQKIRIAIETAYGFVTTFDWRGFGTWIGQAINGFFENIDFSMAAQTLSSGIIGALNSLTEAIAEVDWYGLGQQVKEFLVNIDWAGICEALFEAFGAALGGLSEFLLGLIEDAWRSVVEWWRDTAFEDGHFTIEGLLNGILDALKNIGTWIKEHIFNPFISGFKKVFGINSPSTVMEEQGNFLMEGLFNGISSLVEKVVSIFTDIKKKISEKWEQITTKTKDAWNSIKVSLSSAWNGIKTMASSIFNGIKQNISTIWNQIKSRTTSAWNGIKNAIKVPINAIIGFLNALISAAKNAWNRIADFLSFDIQIPAALQAITGWSRFSLTVPRITGSYKIPYLATGAVIPPNAPFMAVLGDQKHGTNIEAPVSTIEAAVEKAVRNAMENQSAVGTMHIHVDVSGRQMAEVVLTEMELKRLRSGRPATGGA